MTTMHEDQRIRAGQADEILKDGDLPTYSELRLLLDQAASALWGIQHQHQIGVPGLLDAISAAIPNYAPGERHRKAPAPERNLSDVDPEAFQRLVGSSESAHKGA